MDGQRVILHVDMDAFFASVEQLDNPDLRGKPVLVGGDGPRGVVCAASYESREYGCRSAQPMAVAKRLCPHAVVVHPRGGRYGELSKAVFEIMRRYTPLVEPLSIDEAFLDVTGSRLLFGDGVSIAERVRREIAGEVRLTATVGVAPNKFLAKLGSGMNKPDGLTVIDETWITQTLPGLPIRRMWGVGPASEERLNSVGVRTFGDLQRVPEQALRQVIGSDAERLRKLARGEDYRRVVPSRDARSISHEQTFGTDVEDPDAVRRVLLHQVESVAGRLRAHDLCGRTVTVKIRFGNFETITRSESLDTPTDRTDLIWNTACGLFDRWAEKTYSPVRLIGAGVSQLTDSETGAQMGLFTQESDERQKRLDRVTDRIHERFGRKSIKRGG